MFSEVNVYDIIMIQEDNGSAYIESINMITTGKALPDKISHTYVTDNFEINCDGDFANPTFTVTKNKALAIIPKRYAVVGVWRFNQETKNFDNIYYA